MVLHWLYNAFYPDFCVRMASTMEFQPVAGADSFHTQEAMLKMARLDRPDQRVAMYLDDNRIIYDDGSSTLTSEEIVCFLGLCEHLVYSTHDTTYIAIGDRPICESPVYLQQVKSVGWTHVIGISVDGALVLLTYIDDSWVPSQTEYTDRSDVWLLSTPRDREPPARSVFYHSNQTSILFVDAVTHWPILIGDTNNRTMCDVKWDGGLIIDALGENILVREATGKYSVYRLGKGKLRRIAEDIYYAVNRYKKRAI